MQVSTLEILLRDPKYERGDASVQGVVLPIKKGFVRRVALFASVLPRRRREVHIYFGIQRGIFRGKRAVVRCSDSVGGVNLVRRKETILCYYSRSKGRCIVSRLGGSDMFNRPFLLSSSSRRCCMYTAAIAGILFVSCRRIVGHYRGTYRRRDRVIDGLLRVATLHSERRASQVCVLSQSSAEGGLVTCLRSLTTRGGTKGFGLPVSCATLTRCLDISQDTVVQRVGGLSSRNIVQESKQGIRLLGWEESS